MRVALALGVCLVAGLCGCGHHPPKKADDPKAPEAKPTQVTARGFTGRWMEKIGHGRVRKVMEVHSRQGALDSQTNSGTLYGVDGTIYREGAAKATFTAPLIDADRGALTLVARQGVVLHSLDPPGATIRCRTMTWRADVHQIVAQDDVYFDYSPPGSGHPQAFGGPFRRVTIDTAMRDLTIP